MVLVLCHSVLGPISQSDWGLTEHCVQVTGPETCRLYSAGRWWVVGLVTLIVG